MAFAASSGVLPFGEAVVNAIFKEKKDAILLFTNGDGQNVLDGFAAAADDSDTLYSVVDDGANSDHFKRFAEYLGVDVSSTPVVVFIKEARTKFLSTEAVSQEGIQTFLAKVERGEISKFLKSAPIPEDDDQPVKTLVGKNYNDILADQREYLVKIHAPWSGDSKRIAPHFVAAAAALSNNPNIVLAELDGTLNEVEGVEITGYPTVLWYSKDKNAEPIKFSGGKDTEGIIDWIKDHTQHEWVELVAATEEE